MLSARYDTINLTDSGYNGGKQTSYVLGATWVPIDHIKFQLNYSKNDIDKQKNTTFGTTSLASGTANAVVLRTQIDW